VIASDVGGHKELIDDQKNGYLFKADDANALAQTALNLIGSRLRWDKVRKQGRLYVEQQRNWPVSVARYEKVYQQLVQNK